MPRDRKGLVRKSGGQSKDPYIIFVIATEGSDTEPGYFRHVEARLRRMNLDRLVKIETLKRSPSVDKSGHTRKDTRSSVDAVINLLDDYRKQYNIHESDELWCLIDRDHWISRNIAAASKSCRQKHYEFCMTTPCFEFWLLLHFADLDQFTKDDSTSILVNRRNNAGNRTRTEYLLNELMKANGLGAYKKSGLPDISENIERAVKQAFMHDLDSGHWQENRFCTRLHVLLQRIFKFDIDSV